VKFVSIGQFCSDKKYYSLGLVWGQLKVKSVIVVCCSMQYSFAIIIFFHFILSVHIIYVFLGKLSHWQNWRQW